MEERSFIFHVLFYQLNVLAKLLGNAVAPKLSFWMICSGTSDAQLTPAGKIPNTGIILYGGMFVLVLCGSLICGGHISKHFTLWFDPVLSQRDRWKRTVHGQFPKWTVDLTCLVAAFLLKGKFTNADTHRCAPPTAVQNCFSRTVFNSRNAVLLKSSCSTGTFQFWRNFPQESVKMNHFIFPVSFW